jgi:predicted RNase H-like nuclease
MPWVAGVDGCRAGWVRVSRELASGELRLDAIPSEREIVTREPRARVIALDIPIGLPERGSRECDLRARAVLGRPRGSSVFPAPLRSALEAATHDEASAITEAIDGRRMSIQAFAILPKVRAIDELLAMSPEARQRVREVHPELSFWAWNDRSSLRHSKRAAAGARERLALAERWLGRDLLPRLRGSHSKREIGDDDVLDAIAALWTAHRIARGAAETLPRSPLRDRRGLPMQIVF